MSLKLSTFLLGDDSPSDEAISSVKGRIKAIKHFLMKLLTSICNSFQWLYFRFPQFVTRCHVGFPGVFCVFVFSSIISRIISATPSHHREATFCKLYIYTFNKWTTRIIAIYTKWTQDWRAGRASLAFVVKLKAPIGKKNVFVLPGGLNRPNRLTVNTRQLPLRPNEEKKNDTLLSSSNCFSLTLI